MNAPIEFTMIHVDQFKCSLVLSALPALSAPHDSIACMAGVQTIHPNFTCNIMEAALWNVFVEDKQ